LGEIPGLGRTKQKLQSKGEKRELGEIPGLGRTKQNCNQRGKE